MTLKSATGRESEHLIAPPYQSPSQPPDLDSLPEETSIADRRMELLLLRLIDGQEGPSDPHLLDIQD